MIVSSYSIDGEIKVPLIQLEKKINQFTEIVSRLVIPLMQVQAPTLVAKLFLMFEEDFPSS